MVRSKTYSLHELSRDYLQLPHLNLTAEMLTACLQDTKRLPELITNGIWDVICVHKLMLKLNMLQLVFEITKLCGNVLNDTCRVVHLNRCEFLMLHAFHERNYILPPNFTKKEDSCLTIKGGLVLEPEIGLHKNFVLAMDFQALYPSIIREFNVCFTTLKMEDDEIVEVDGEGVLPQLVADLIEHRKSILHEIESKSNCGNGQQSADYIRYLKIKQGVVKRITNSIFGYLGCKSSRFLAEHLANFITAKGRQILSDTVAVLQNFESVKIIYGDTDSVMVETNLETYQEVMELSKKLRKAVNSKYRYVAIENAGIYKPFYILRKKKYAGIRHMSAQRTEEEIKGLDVVRRDWSGISSTAGKKVLREILNETDNMDVKIYNYLEDIRMDLEENHMKYDVDSFAINKKLNKDPDKYSRKLIEHVNVALRYNATHVDKLKEGDTVSYVICEDGSSRTPSERVYHVEEYTKSDTLKVDVDYYLSHQIYPVVKRICLPLCNTVSGKELLIALKANLHKNRARRENGTVKKKKKIEKPESTLNPSTNFVLKCNICKQEKLVSYASLDFIRPCIANCEYVAISNFQDRLTSVLRVLTLSYVDKERSFSETYEILVKIRVNVEQIKRTNKQLSIYLAAIDTTREELLRDINCWNLRLNEIFQFSGNVTF